MQQKKELIIKKDSINMRLDKYLANNNKDLSRSYVQQLIEEGYVLVNQKKVNKNSYKLNPGDIIKISIPDPKIPDLKPQDLDLNILYEDKDILIINKKAGRLVHPTPHTRENTLVNALLSHCDNLAGIAGVKRPGIVHRLDKNTTGTLVVAKNNKSHQHLSNQFKKRKTKKIYLALSKGQVLHDKGKIDAPIGRDPHNRTKMGVVKKNSKPAVTHFKVLEKFSDHTYLILKIDTGRTHQIRVHLSYMGHPLCGDFKYGDQSCDNLCQRPMLHAYKLGFFHPETNEWIEFTSPLPDDFKNSLSMLRKNQ